MSATLISLAASIGAPLVERALSRRLGDAKGQLAAEVLRTIAVQAGVKPEQLGGLAATQPEVVKAAIEATEAHAPEMIALYAAGVERQFDLLMAEQSDPAWMRAWRPAGMYLLGFLWLWQVVGLHVLNAVFKTALPPADWAALMTLTSLYMGLYMGGHTVKDFVSKWSAKGGAA